MENQLLSCAILWWQTMILNFYTWETVNSAMKELLLCQSSLIKIIRFKNLRYSIVESLNLVVTQSETLWKQTLECKSSVLERTIWIRKMLSKFSSLSFSTLSITKWKLTILSSMDLLLCLLLRVLKNGLGIPNSCLINYMKD